MDDPETRRLLASYGIGEATFRTRGRDGGMTEETRAALGRLARPARRSGRLSPLPYHLTVNHRHRFLWFRVAKVATRTLIGYFEAQGVGNDAHFHRVRYPTALFADYHAFAFVRAPLGRFVSAWSDKVVQHNYFGFDVATHARLQRVEAFADWVAAQGDLTEADQHLAPQVRLIDLSRLDFLGRLETFDRDFEVIRQRLDLPARPVTVLNRTRSEAPTPVSEELRAAVAEIYRLDHQVLGYPSP